MSAAPHDPQSPYAVWVRRTDAPLLALAVVFLIVLVLPLLVDLSRPAAVTCQVLDTLIWVAFAIDYVVRLSLAADRRTFLRRNVLDLLVVVVPFLRPIRALRLLRLLRIVSIAGVADRRSASLHARVGTYIVTAATIALILATATMYDAERRVAGANIRTVGDAAWWAVSTISTVGYGDRYPVTTEGRFIAVGLMVVGIALLGVVTATIAAWFVNRLQQAEEAVEEATEATLEDVLGELRRIHERLDRIESDRP